MKKTVLFVATTMSMIAISCGGGHEQKSDTNTEDTTVTHDTAEVRSHFVLPSTVQVGQIFQNAGLNYVPSVTNDPKSASIYNTKVDRLLNYGVYSTDLSYSILNNQNEEAQQYLMAVKSMSDDLGFSEIYETDNLFDRFQNGLGDQQAILDLMIEIQEKTDSYIDDNDFQSEAIVIFTGAWVEGMYLGVKASDPKNDHLISTRLVEQMTVLENLLEGLNQLKVKSTKLNEVKNRLQKMHASYMQMDEIQNFDGPMNELEVSMTSLVELANQIVDLRTLIVN